MWRTFPTNTDVGDDTDFEHCSSNIARAGKEEAVYVGRLCDKTELMLVAVYVGRLCDKTELMLVAVYVGRLCDKTELMLVAVYVGRC